VRLMSLALNLELNESEIVCVVRFALDGVFHALVLSVLGLSGPISAIQSGVVLVESMTLMCL